MTLRQYVEGLWALGIDDIRFRQDPKSVLETEHEPEKLERLAAIMGTGTADAVPAFVLGAIAAMHEAAEITERYAFYAAGYDGPQHEIPLELALGGLGAVEYFDLLDRPLRDALIYLSMHFIYLQLEYILNSQD